MVRELVLSKAEHINAATTDDRLTKYMFQEEGKNILEWGTDLMGGMRIDQQLIYEGTAKWVGYVLCYLVLVVYTLIFAWTYLKRVLYMAFLTIIAPLVAMTYPIDKITDGKAQAFNAWLKEYLFNLLIQPLHLLLYVMLVGAAYQLAASSPIYAVVAIGFITPAEKLLRKFFGFNKAQTPGALGGAAGAALAFTGLQKLMNFGSGNSKSENDEKGQEESKIKFSRSNGVNPKAVVADSVGEPEDNAIRMAETPSYKQENDEASGNETNQTRQSESAQVTPVVTTNPQREISQKALMQNEKLSNVQRIKQEINPKKPNALKRTIRAAGTGIGSYARGLGNKMYKRIQRGRPIRALARGALGVAGATTFGMAALALGIASGDPSKAFQYTTAGIAGGYATGKGVAGKTIDALSVDTKKVKQEVEMEYYGEDYKKIKLQEQKLEMQQNEENINYLKETLGVSRKEAKHVLETTGGECFDSGIRTVDDIAAVEQMTRDSIEEEVDNWIEENADELDVLEQEDKIKKIEEVRQQFRNQIEEDERKRAIAMKKFSDRTPDLTKAGAKKIESYRQRFRNEMQKEFYDRLKQQGKTEEEAVEQSEQMAIEAANSIINGIIKFDDTKSKILEV